MVAVALVSFVTRPSAPSSDKWNKTFLYMFIYFLRINTGCHKLTYLVGGQPLLPHTTYIIEAKDRSRYLRAPDVLHHFICAICKNYMHANHHYHVSCHVKWETSYCRKYEDLGASRYLRILRDAIDYPCLRYTLLIPLSSYSWANTWQCFPPSKCVWLMIFMLCLSITLTIFFIYFTQRYVLQRIALSR